MTYSKEIPWFLEKLEQINALKFGEITLASGVSSPYYLDLRYLPAYPEFFSTVMNQYYQKIILKLSYDAIIGIPLAGIPFATALSWISKKSLLLLRKSPKQHGLRKIIEGPPISGKTIVLFDDLISSGFSKEYAIQAIRESGGVITDLCVIVDRRPENEVLKNTWAQKMNITIHSLFQFSPELLKEYVSNREK
ncbi:MAG: orotate phosphoribosyltransferase [Candidatus Hodarchaeales archaeon]